MDCNGGFDEDYWKKLSIKCNFNLKKIAKAGGVSVRTVQRHFAKHLNQTVREWIENYRLTLAREELLKGKRPKEVSIDLHFKQLSHFSRCFKRVYGVSPRRAKEISGKDAVI